MAEENGAAQASAPKARSAAAIVALVLGIVALATSFLPFVNNLSCVLALVGAVFALVGLVGTLRGKKAGKVMAILSLVLNVVAVAAVLATQSAYKAAIDEAFTQATSTSATVVSDGATPAASDAADVTAEEQSTSAKPEEQPADATKDLAVGTTITTSDGLAVTVDSVETGLTKYDGSTVTGVHVTYVNNGEDGAHFNLYDWKGEDANGAQTSTTIYTSGTDNLSSGTLAKGGTVSGNIYFNGDLARVLYFGNMFDKTAAASWVLS